MKDEVPEESPLAVQRLCSEIQLFDLCELDSCRFKSNRFCTNEKLLEKFESIKDEDVRQSILCEDEETDDEVDSDSAADFNDYEDSFEGDED